jgi:hypothetical protein
MYVAELDRPWTDTPFMFQGFVLENAEQLEILKKFCKSVTVDYERSALPDPLPLKPMSVRHSTQVPVEREVEKAKVAHVGTQAAVREVLAAVRANKMLDAKSVEQAVGSMTKACCAIRMPWCFSPSCAKRATTRNRTRSTSRST